MKTLVKNNILLILYFVISLLYINYRLFLDVDELLFFRSSALALLALNYAFKVIKELDYLFLTVLLLEFVAGYIFLLSDDGFIEGLTIFLIINLLLTVIITKRIGVIEKEDVTKTAVISGVTFLLATYFIFKSAGHIKFLLVIFGVVFSILLSCSYLDYKKNSTVFSVWFFIGVILFLARYMIAGYTRLLSSSDFFNVLEALAYVIGIFCLTKAMISKNQKESIKSSAQSHS